MISGDRAGVGLRVRLFPPLGSGPDVMSAILSRIEAMNDREIIESNGQSIAVVICCFNGASRLSITLDHLAKQDGISVVILVDNASTDGSGTVAEALWEKLQARFPLRVVREPRPGIVFARQCGLATAHELGVDVVVFVDDDNWLHGQWAPVLKRVFSDNDRVAAVGGLGRPVFLGDDTPPWFIQHQAAYACGPQGEPGLVPFSRGFLFGACLALRMEAWRSIASKFSPSLTGRQGNLVLAGDDAELCLFLQEHGWRLWYEPSLCFDHYMPRGRLTIEYLERLCLGFGLSSRVLLVRRSKLEGNRLRRRIAQSRWLYRLYFSLRLAVAIPLLVFSPRPHAAFATLRGAAQAV